jgi:hypothetical protein
MAPLYFSNGTKRIDLSQAVLEFEARALSRNYFHLASIVSVAGAIAFVVGASGMSPFQRYAHYVTAAFMMLTGIALVFFPRTKLVYRIQNGMLEVCKNDKCVRTIAIAEIKQIRRQVTGSMSIRAQFDLGTSYTLANVVVFTSELDSGYPIAAKSPHRLISSLLKVKPKIQIAKGMVPLPPRYYK